MRPTISDMSSLPDPEKSSVNRLVFRLSLGRIGLIPISTLLLGIVFSAVEPRFVTLSNVLNIAFQAGVLALVAFGQFFPMLSGGIDFSVGAQIGLASVVAALLMVKLGTAIGVIGSLLAASSVGLVIGLIVTRFRANALIVSLGMYWLVQGVTLMLSNGQNIYGFSKSFELIGLLRIGGVPVAFIWAILGFVVCYVVLNMTIYGRHLYALGANERAAKLSGIAVESNRVMAYVICSLLTGLASLILTAALGSGQPFLGTDIGMQNFVVVFLSGTRWGGGEGTITAVALGVIFVAVLANGLNVLNVSSYTQIAVSGAILMLALTVDMARREGLPFKLRIAKKKP